MSDVVEFGLLHQHSSSVVIYAEITLGSIISLLFAVDIHNAGSDPGSDTDAAVQTRDTPPCFSPADQCVTYTSGTKLYFLKLL